MAEFDARIEKSNIGNLSAKFEIGESKSIVVINVSSLIGSIKLYVIEANTPFLLCLQDVIKLGTYFNNKIDTIEMFDK